MDGSVGQELICRYEAAFPFASEKEKDAEKIYIEKHHTVVHDTNVKGVWVTSEVALKIAKEYELEEYIKAMIEASPDKPSDTLTIVPNETKETTKTKATKATKEPKEPKETKEAKEAKETSEPKETKETKAKKEPSTPKLAPEAPRRSRRSASPKKSAAPKPKVPKAPSSTTGATRGRKKKGAGSVVDDESVASTSSPTVPYATIMKAEEAVKRVAEEEEDKPILDSIQVGV